MSGIWLGNMSGGGFSRRIDLTTSGSWPVPAGVYAIIMAGSGGGGGGGAGSSLGGGGGGGGAAEWTDQAWLPVTPGEILTYTIGAAGTPGLAGGSTTLTGSLFGTLTLLRGQQGANGTVNGGSGGTGWGFYAPGAAGGAGGGANSTKVTPETVSSPVCYSSACFRAIATASAGGANTFSGGAIIARFTGGQERSGTLGNANGGGGGHGGEGPFGVSGVGGSPGSIGGDAMGYGAGGGGGGGDTLTPSNQAGGNGSPGFLRFYY